jgi:hypothetical protein
MEVPRDREGTFKTELFERYQRNEKALVLALMEMVSVDLMRSTQCVSTRKVKKITDELCGQRLSWQTVSKPAQKLEEPVQASAESNLERSHTLPHSPCDESGGVAAAGSAVPTVVIAARVREGFPFGSWTQCRLQRDRKGGKYYSVIR